MDAVEADLKASQVSVTGVFDPPKLVDYVYKRTGKHAVIVKTDPEKKQKEAEAKETKEEKANEESGKEKKADDGGENKESNKEAEGGGGETKSAVEVTPEETIVVELKKNEYYQHYPQRYAMEMYAYPPQIFSDENPNACSVMWMQKMKNIHFKGLNKKIRMERKMKIVVMIMKMKYAL